MKTALLMVTWQKHFIEAVFGPYVAMTEAMMSIVMKNAISRTAQLLKPT
jgi:hypothetical protein